MSLEIIIVLSILGITVALMVFDILRIDLVAILAMLLLVWTKIITPYEATSGFSSHAVISMIAVMIMGSGVASTSIMNKLSTRIVKTAGKKRSRIIALISGSAGLLSAFMQNVGAAALFLPAVLGISKKEKIPASSLIMPLGFAAIAGGTLTMIASGPMIILNDILKASHLKPFSIFSVTPVGLILLGLVIMYFFFFGGGKEKKNSETKEPVSEQKKLIDTWHLPFTIYRYNIPEKSSLDGLTPENSGLWDRFSLHIVALSKEKGVEYAPWRNTKFEKNTDIIILGDPEDSEKFANEYGLILKETPEICGKLRDPDSAGFAEVMIHPRSSLAGKSIREISFRKEYSVEPVIIFSGGETLSGDYSDRKLKAGDTLIIHGLWNNVEKLKKDDGLVVLTPIEKVKSDPKKGLVSILTFAGALGLTLTGFPISISLLTGAFAMILFRVITIEEAYRSVEWKVVFLIAGLIPLGIAMQNTGTAEYIAQKVTSVVRGEHPLLLMSVVAFLSTVFSLFMSNVASTVVLAPIVIGIANINNIDPRPLVLLVAVCSANSFILPTHQVNAMLMTPGGYTNKDYIRSGGIITILFGTAAVLSFYFIYI